MSSDSHHSPTDTGLPGQSALQISTLPAVAAGVLWIFLTFGHGLGLDVTTFFFEWARTPAALHPEGGAAGFARAELLLYLVFGGMAVAVLAWLTYRFRTAHLSALGNAAVPWIIWLALSYLVWKTLILYSTELVHFAQYALIAALVNRALDRGRRPQLAFVVVVTLGLFDEVWQHYGLHVWVLGEHNHWMDWSDPILNVLGVTAGILPAVTLQRLRGDLPPSGRHVIRTAVVVGAVLLLPLLLLDPTTTAALMGSYPYDGFWAEHVNDKPVHWLKPHEGIPLCLAALLILGTLLEPQRRALSQRSMAIVAVLLILVVRPVSRREGRAVHEVVASVQVPRIQLAAGDPAVTTSHSITIDGVLDEPAWTAATRLGPFVLNVDGGDSLSCNRGGRFSSTAPLSQTHARLLWDDEALFIAFEVADDDVWARDLTSDHGALAVDEGVKVLVDVGGDELTYFQFDISPLNRVRDLFILVPAAPLDYSPWSRNIGLVGWDADDFDSAVSVQGTLDVARGWDNAPDRDTDRGYTIELAIPWKTFRTTSTPGGAAVRQTNEPQPGERWRLALYRIESPRPAFSDAEARDRLSVEEARRYLGVSEQKFADLRHSRLKPISEETDEIWFHHVARAAAQECAELQAWTPTYLDFYRPARFGVVEFTD